MTIINQLILYHKSVHKIDMIWANVKRYLNKQFGEIFKDIWQYCRKQSHVAYSLEQVHLRLKLSLEAC